MLVSALDAYNYAYDHFPTFPPSWKISENFTWNEVFTNECISDGMPMLEVYENAAQLAKQLQIIRTKLGKPIHVHCWVRQIKHNKRAGSTAKRSPHINGRAVDFHINGMAESDVRKKFRNEIACTHRSRYRRLGACRYRQFIYQSLYLGSV